MKARACSAALMGFLFLLAGCAGTKTWVSTPQVQTVRTPDFTAAFTPLTGDKPYFNFFRLEIANHAEGELNLDWNASRYLYGGQLSGGFVYRGIQKENIHDPPPDVIAGGGRLVREIAPLRWIAWRGGKPGYKDRESFSTGPLPEGRHGILLVVRQNGKVFRETLTVDIAVAAD